MLPCSITDFSGGTITLRDGTEGFVVDVTQTNLQFLDGPGDLGEIAAEGSEISWTHAPDVDDEIEVKYRLLGEETWLDDTISGSGPEFTFDLSDAGEGPIEFLITYTHDLETEPYAQASGILGKRRHFAEDFRQIDNDQVATFTSLAPVEGFNTANGFITWTNPADSNTTVTFSYQVDSDTWQELTSIANGTGFAVDQRALPPGTYNYDITYLRSGENVPYVHGTGSFTIARQLSGGGVSLLDQTKFFTTSSELISGLAPTVLQTVDRWGNVISVTNALGNTTDYRYNQFSQLIEIKLPETTVVDTRDGDVTTDAERPTTLNHYDLLGRLLGTTDAKGNLNVAMYNAAGQIVSEVHADLGEKRYLYNAFGEQSEVIDELGFRTRNTYDAAGQLTQVERELTVGAIAGSDDDNIIVESYNYDEAGRRISETNGEGETVEYGYDLQGNVVRRRSIGGFESTTQYDDHGRKISETDANGNTATWEYDDLGRLKEHTDLGGAVTQYAYNEAGMLIQQTSTLGQNLKYEYDEAGHLLRIIDEGRPTAAGAGLVASNRVTQFAYDFGGQRILERTTVDGRVHQNTRIGYNALGLIESLSDTNYLLTYSYDAAGNRTNINGQYYNHDGYGTSNLQTQDLWYTYDKMNRVLISQGDNIGDEVQITESQGVELTYDLKGQRASALKWTNIISGFFGSYVNLPGYSTEEYGYDGAGRLLTTTKDGRLVGERTYDKASRQLTEGRLSVRHGGGSLLSQAITMSYDSDGRILEQRTFRDGYLESIVRYGTAQYIEAQEVSYYEPWLGFDFSYTIPAHWTTGFDDAGILRGYTVEVYDQGRAQYGTTYKLDYRLGEGYQQTTENASSSSHLLPGATLRTYNVNGELVQYTDQMDGNKNRYFANNAQGQALAVVQGAFDGQAGRLTVDQAFANAQARTGNQVKGQYFFYANGQSVGSFGQLQDESNQFEANFDVNFTPVSSQYPASTPSQVIVQAGDTLKIIAARIFGDAGLWYVLAEENGLTDPDAELVEGTQLRVPNEVVSLSNKADSFKPFDIREAIGDTTPTQPLPPARKKGCGVIGQILVAIVAIVVTYFTAGATSGFFAGALGSTGGAIVTGAVSAVAGSVVSQGVGIAIGQQDGFSWKGVAAAAITGGIGGGLANFGGAAKLLNVTDKIGGQIVNAAVNSTIGQGVNIALGLQKEFSWKAVAAAAAAAPVAAWVGEKVSGAVGKSFGEGAGQVVGGLASGFVQQATSVALNGGRIDYANLVADAFGNALGNSIVDGIAGSQTRAAVAKLSKDGQARYEELKSQGYSHDKALTLAQGGLVTYALDDAPMASPLKTEWVSDEPSYADYRLTSRSRPELDIHAMDRALLNDLKLLNDKTQIPLLGEAKDYLDRKLEGLADFSMKDGVTGMTPVYGGLYAAGKATLGLFPEGLFDVAPELAAVGKLAKFGKAAEDLGRIDSAFSRADDVEFSLGDELAAGSARRVMPTAEDFAAPFQTLGLDVDARSVSEGRRMIYELQKSGYSSEVALARANEFISTGSTLPVATPIDRTDSLIKLVPRGKPEPHTSSYWITESEYRSLAQQPNAIADRLGLPLQSRADVYDVYKIRPMDSGAVVYQSVTAPTRQGNFLQGGGSIQTLVIDRNVFTPPALIGTVPGKKP